MTLENFVQFQYDAKNALLISTWNTTEDMPDNLYEQAILRYVHEVQTNQALYSLLDIRWAAYTVHPSMQQWASEQITPLYTAKGLKRTAYVASKHFIAQLSIEQLVEEGGEQLSNKRRFFESIEEAKDWILAREVAQKPEN